jgi:micrococcal nuclease
MNGVQTKVRLIGVDTPETVHPQKPVEAFGKEASAFLGNLLRGESVYVVFEEGRNALDKYGRTLAYLYRVPDALFVNLEIVRQGYGHAYTRYPFEHMELFRYYEQQARETGRGLWAASAAEAPSSAVSQVTVQRAEAAPTAIDNQAAVFMTNSGSKYHLEGCRYLSKSKVAISLSDAKARGLTACSVCRPPD